MTGFPNAPRDLQDESMHRRLLADTINRINQGKINATGEITLRANEVTTTLSDLRLTYKSYIMFMPITADASSAFAGLWVSDQANGSCTLNHISDASLTQSFRYLIIG